MHQEPRPSSPGEKATTIELKDQDKPVESQSGARIYLRIFTYSDYIDWILNGLACVAAIGSGVLLGLTNIVFGGFVTVINDFSSNGNASVFRSESNEYALYFVYLAIARFCLAYTYAVCATVSSTRIASKIRHSFLKSTLSQNIAFFDREGQSSVATQTTNNGNLIQQGIGEKLGLCIQAISAFFAAFVVAFIAQWKLTLITSCVVPAILIVVGITSGFDAKYQTQMLDIYNRADAHAEDAISSMRTVHAFSAAPKIVSDYDEFLGQAHKIGNKKSPLYAILFSSEFFLVYAAYALAFWRGIHMYNSGEIDSPGPIITVIFSIIVATSSMTQIAPHIITFTGAVSGAATLFKIIDQESEIDPFNNRGQMPDQVDGDLQFSNVSFAYPTRADVEVLHNFTLRLQARKVTALVGASGSGKSTIVGLIERWYDPTSGSIRLDGGDVQDLNLKWLRSKIGLVGQEPVLFTGTVFENVCYGLIGTQWEYADSAKKRQLVEDACKTANAHDFVMKLQSGYDSQCGERGGLLSGGQKQRIAIARSIVSEPRILLLDEATSALDPHAEGVVQQALDQASRDRTTVVIAHKLATIKSADNIVVISKGSIVEQGAHEVLLRLDGFYAKLVKLQDLGTADSTEMDSIERTDSDNLTPQHTLTQAPSSQRQNPLEQKDPENFDLHTTISTFAIIWKLLYEQKNLKWYYLLTLLASLAGGAAYPGQALLFSREMDIFLLSGDRLLDRGNFFALMFFVLALGILVIFSILGFSTNTIAQTITHVYKKEMFTSILRQSMQFFDRPENMVGAITSRLSSNPQSLTELMGFNLGIILICIVNLTASCVLALANGWKLSLVVIFGGLPPLVASGYIRMRLDLKMNNDTAKRYSTSASLAGEAVGAIRTVSALMLEDTVLRRYEAQLKDVVRSTVAKTSYMMIWFSLTQTIEFLFLALGFWYGCRLLASGEYTMLQFYIVFISVFFSGQAASQFFGWSTSITKAKEAGNYIFWLRHIRSEIAETEENRERGPDYERKEHELELKQIRFSYPLQPKMQVLRGIDISIKPGQFIALVGASGCGKSTIIALLERFYDPTTGTISLDGTDIKRLSPQRYRRITALVQQEPTLYLGSIRSNISLGLPAGEEITDDMIITACKDAQCWEFISSLPEALNTPCGSRGLSLSGGQRQRIAIARALVRSPKILLLDEATSALDTESEKIVQVALMRAAADEQRITVAVAHRLSTVKHADVICVVLSGRIVESGTHGALLEKGGLYTRMCQAQSLDRAV